MIVQLLQSQEADMWLHYRSRCCMHIPPTACPWNCRWSAKNWCSERLRTAGRARCSSSCWSHLECAASAARSQAWSICRRSRVHQPFIYEDIMAPSATIVPTCFICNPDSIAIVALCL